MRASTLTVYEFPLPNLLSVRVKTFAIFAEYSCEKNMGDVIFFGSTIVSRGVSTNYVSTVSSH